MKWKYVFRETRCYTQDAEAMFHLPHNQSHKSRTRYQWLLNFGYDHIPACFFKGSIARERLQRHSTEHETFKSTFISIKRAFHIMDILGGIDISNSTHKQSMIPSSYETSIDFFNGTALDDSPVNSSAELMVIFFDLTKPKTACLMIPPTSSIGPSRCWVSL